MKTGSCGNAIEHRNLGWPHTERKKASPLTIVSLQKRTMWNRKGQLTVRIKGTQESLSGPYHSCTIADTCSLGHWKILWCWRDECSLGSCLQFTQLLYSREDAHAMTYHPRPKLLLCCIRATETDTQRKGHISRCLRDLGTHSVQQVSSVL